MDLFLNVNFIKLLIVISFCVVPGVAGLYLIVAGEETKRSIRRTVCRALFDSGSVFSYKGFARFMNIVGTFLLLFSFTAAWFLLVRQYFM